MTWKPFRQLGEFFKVPTPHEPSVSHVNFVRERTRHQRAVSRKCPRLRLPLHPIGFLSNAGANPSSRLFFFLSCGSAPKPNIALLATPRMDAENPQNPFDSASARTLNLGGRTTHLAMEVPSSCLS